MQAIELRDIRKTYHLGEVDVPVLKDITLRVAQGELVALMGTSGSGKSTLMHILGCLDHPTAGEYWLDGKDISGDLIALYKALGGGWEDEQPSGVALCCG